MLTALIVVNFNAARERARDVQRKSDLNQIKKALRMYYNDQDPTVYPTHSSDNKIEGCGTGVAPGACDWGSGWARQTMTYMKILPQDPIEGESYFYQQQTGGQDFCLWAELENKSDGDITKSQNHCSTCSVGDYDYVVCAD